MTCVMATWSKPSRLRHLMTTLFNVMTALYQRIIIVSVGRAHSSS